MPPPLFHLVGDIKRPMQHTASVTPGLTRGPAALAGRGKSGTTDQVRGDVSGILAVGMTPDA